MEAVSASCPFIHRSSTLGEMIYLLGVQGLCIISIPTAPHLQHIDGAKGEGSMS